MNQLSLTVSTAFALTTLASLLLFLKATGWNRLAAIGLLAWCAVLALLARAGFFTVYDAMPPRFLLVVLPPLVATLTLFFTARGRRWMNGLDARTLTLLHTMRVPVELVLFWLAAHKAVPQLMTFEGRNFDILTGLTAPVIWYLVFVRRALGYRSLLAWNLVCSGLLLWIVAHAILSAPTPCSNWPLTSRTWRCFISPLSGCRVWWCRCVMCRTRW